jgi:protein subunit release factor A
VTDHRIGLSLKNLQQVMEGDALRDIIDALKKHNDEATLEDMLEQAS